MTDINKTFFSNKVQEIHTTVAGIVTQSSNSIFKIELGKNLYDLHPFFESLKIQLSSDASINMAFPCVQLDLNDNEIVCDVTIKKERGSLAILLFDYTDHYENLHEAAQEKKTALLNEQAFELKAKHKEEQKAYLGFIKKRINGKVLKQMEHVAADIQKLKSTQLTEEQSELLQDIEKNIGDLHLRAIQIKRGIGIDFS